MLPIMAAAATLKRLPRMGWLLAGVVAPESVADHSFATAVVALALAAMVNESLAQNGLATPLDVGRVAQIAVVHDLAESEVTDLPRRTTMLLGKDVKHGAEAKAMAGLSQVLPAMNLAALWCEYSDLSTPEGRVVQDADKLEMVHQALIYESAGNKNLGEFFQAYRWHYSTSEEIYATLMQTRHGAGHP